MKKNGLLIMRRCGWHGLNKTIYTCVRCQQHSGGTLLCYGSVTHVKLMLLLLSTIAALKNWETQQLYESLLIDSSLLHTTSFEWQIDRLNVFNNKSIMEKICYIN